MASFAKALPSKAGALLLLSVLTQHASAIDVGICADFNTASMGKNVSNLQSNGLCSDYCRGDYVFAITSHEGCWCSNYEPAESDVVSTSKCDFPCLGYPLEYCGGDDLYGYLNLGANPSGTKGSGDSDSGGGSTASSTSKPSSTKVTSKPVQTTVTVDGTTKTILVTPTATGDESNEKKPVPTGGSSGLGGGAIAGIVIGAVAGIALIGLLLWFLLRRKKQNEEGEFRDDPSIRGSSRGRMGSHQHDLSIAGSAASPGSAGNRSSMLQVDPRMDPFRQGLYARNNGSAESVNTLRDDHDYSRRIQQPKVLRATNPDPDN